MTTLQAIRKSVKHWVIDIYWPLLKGDYIYKEYNVDENVDDLIWSNTEKLVPIFTNDCALCVLCVSCRRCPLRSCNDESPYGRFIANPCLKTAKGMINKLVEVYWIEEGRDLFE